MGLGGCYGVLKYFLVFYSLIFAALGIAGTVFSVWMLVDPSLAVSLTRDSVITLIIILIASVLLIVVAIFGLIGSLQEHHCSLITFASLLLIILVAEVSAGAWGYANQDSLRLELKNSLQKIVEVEYYEEPNRKMVLDTFQQKLHCCGAKAPSDWFGSKQMTLSVTAVDNSYNIPMSCCKEDVSRELCKNKTQGIKPTSSIDVSVVYENGCYKALVAIVEQNLFWILLVIIIVAVIQLLAIIFGLILGFAAKKSNRYKA